MNFARSIVWNCALLVPTIGVVSTTAFAQDFNNSFDEDRRNLNGLHNSAFGASALYPAPGSNGSHNSAFGSYALRNNLTGVQNTAVGSSALRANQYGRDNTGIGFEALRYTAGVADGDAGNYNTGVGSQSLYRNTSGESNTAVGSDSMNANTIGSGNSALGAGALTLNIDGTSNVAVGEWAMSGNTSGDNNTALGAQSLAFAGAGEGNTAVGFGALYYATYSFNTALGARACETCAGYSNTVSVGYGAYADADYATAVGGPGALPPTSPPGSAPVNFTHAGAQYALAVGNSTQATGTNSTAVGSLAQATGINSMALGYGAQATGNNTVQIGNAAVSRIYGGTALIVNTSDRRYKTNIKENVPGLAFINKLKPVTFKWDLAKLNELDGVEGLASDPVLGDGREAKAKKVFTGFIAQDVEAAAEECGYDFSGVVKPENEKSQYQLGYSEFVVPLVKAVQEQQKEIEELRLAVRTLAKDGRLPGDRLGQGPAPATSQHAGMLDNLWSGAMTMLCAALALLHFKRRGASPLAH